MPRGSLTLSHPLLPLALMACAHASAAAPAAPTPLDLTPAATTAFAAPVTVDEVRAGELPLTLDPYERCPSARCGVAGEAAQVTLDSRREMAFDLFERYVRAVNGRSVADLRPLLDDTVGNTREGSSVPREQVVGLHARLFELMDARGFEADGVSVYSQQECRRQSCGASMEPGDWYIQWRTPSFRASPVPGAATAPTQMIVRWRDGAPRVAAFNQEFLTRRNLFVP